MALDPLGDIYISDSGGSLIRRVDGNTGIITTVADDGNASNGGQPSFVTWIIRIATPVLQAQGQMPAAVAPPASLSGRPQNSPNTSLRR